MLPFRISRFISRPLVTNQVIRRLSMATSQDPIVKALEPFSTCDVSDALLKLKYLNGGFLSNLTLWSPERQTGSTKIVGPAFTVKYVPLSDTESPKFSGHYIDTIPSGSVVFISCPPRVVNAVYGGLMSNRAQYLGAVGTIVDGRVRDLQEHRDLGYPVFARDIGTTSPSEVVRVSSTNTAVKLQTEDQDATINPGDYLIGDINGVVCLPKGLAEKAISLMQPQVDADLKMAADIQKGMSFVEASKLHRSGLPKA